MKEYKWYKENGRRFPSGDQRVFYNLADEPEIYIVGAAARGIIQTAKRITPAEKVFSVEIDPSIVQIMAKDFYKESGKAYRGLKPVIGNALALLKSLDRKFDIITLINTHSARTIGYRSGPDHLQTKESYDLYLDHLTDDGFKYLKGVMAYGEVPEVFDMIESGDFSPLAEEGFDTRLVTNDLPFRSLATASVPEIDNLLKGGGVVFVVLTLLFTIGAFFKSNPSHATYLTSYNILIGFGYFFVEVMLLQIYQNIFVSPSWSLVLVLGALLVSSGVGGMFTTKLKPWQVTAMLIPVLVTAIFLPRVLLSSGLPAFIGKFVSVLLICATGFLMGYYFPRGLELAAKWGISMKVPHYFAINSVAGSFAVILALFLGVKIGYQATIIIAVLCYCAAGLSHRKDEELESGDEVDHPRSRSACS